MTSDHRRQVAQDPRSTQQLVEIYLGNPESEEARQALAIIHARGGPEEFHHGARLAKAATEAERIAGADILAQLGWKDRTHLEESVSALLELLDDPSEAVVSAAAIALGHRHHPRAIQRLVQRSTHPSADVRNGVVHGLSGHDDPSAVEALIRLASDADRDVRNWATFGVAQRTTLDSPAIREALLARAEDEDAEIRGEALIGLARRGDARALTFIQQELGGEFHGDWAVEAAGLLSDPRLHQLIEALYRSLDPEERARFKRTFADALESLRSKS